MVFGPWDSLRDWVGLQEQIECDRGPAAAGWVPAVDVYETENQYVLTAELPGFRRDDVRIDVHDGQLTLRGQRRDPGIQPERYHRLERAYGTFRRTFTFAHAMDESTIIAEFQAGVLTVRIPKVPAESRRVPVR